MSNVEIIDGSDIQGNHLGDRIRTAVARARGYSHPVHVEFSFNRTKVLVAGDSEISLLLATFSAQRGNPLPVTDWVVGPHPARLTFEEDKATPLNLIWEGRCIPVKAHQLEEDGWAECLRKEGHYRAYSFASDWYVKRMDKPEILTIPDALYKVCPCPSHNK